jgi:hypothetical protein
VVGKPSDDLAPDTLNSILHPCITAGYCGKQGQPRTQRQYIEFLTWQSTLEWSWPFGMLVLFFLNRRKIRFRRSAPRQ